MFIKLFTLRLFHFWFQQKELQEVVSSASSLRVVWPRCQHTRLVTPFWRNTGFLAKTTFSGACAVWFAVFITHCVRYQSSPVVIQYSKLITHNDVFKEKGANWFKPASKMFAICCHEIRFESCKWIEMCLRSLAARTLVALFSTIVYVNSVMSCEEAFYQPSQVRFCTKFSFNWLRIWAVELN